MNKMGNIVEGYKKYKSFREKVKNSYIYKLISKILSFIGTMLLIFLLIIGGMMFYFNMKAKSYSEKGMNYTPPFGLYTIISGSMQPSINVYDVVVATEVKDLKNIKVGDIITFISSWDINYGTTVTHRVISISKTETGEFQFATKGDWNKTADGAVVTQDNLIGKVVMRIPQLGRIQFFLATKMGWFIVIFIPALFIIVMDIIKILKLYVLKNNINNVKDSQEIDKVYFEGELLDNRDVGDINLESTIRLDMIEDNLTKDLMVKLKDQPLERSFVKVIEKPKVVENVPNRAPLRARIVNNDENTTPEKIDVLNTDNVTQGQNVVNEPLNKGTVQRKTLIKRKKL